VDIDRATKEAILASVKSKNETVSEECRLPTTLVREAFSYRSVSKSAVVVANTQVVYDEHGKPLSTVQLRLYSDGRWWVGTVVQRGRYKEVLAGHGTKHRGYYVAKKDDGIVVRQVLAFDAEHARLLMGLDGVDVVAKRSRR
jgi:hypothetical protein